MEGAERVRPEEERARRLFPDAHARFQAAPQTLPAAGPRGLGAGEAEAVDGLDGHPGVDEPGGVGVAHLMDVDLDAGGAVGLPAVGRSAPSRLTTSACRIIMNTRS